MSTADTLKAVAIGVLGGLCSFGLALAGEPTSVWLWSYVLRVLNEG